MFSIHLSVILLITDVKQRRLHLQALVRKIGSCSTPVQQRDIALKRSRLQERVDAFQKQAAKLLNAVSSDGDDSWDDASAREIYAGAEFDGVGEEDDDDEHALSAGAAKEQTPSLGDDSDGCIDAERISLHLPFTLGRAW